VAVLVISYELYIVGIEPWTFNQKLGDAVLIPVGCPHQVRNLKVIFYTFSLGYTQFEQLDFQFFSKESSIDHLSSLVSCSPAIR